MDRVVGVCGLHLPFFCTQVSFSGLVGFLPFRRAARALGPPALFRFAVPLVLLALVLPPNPSPCLLFCPVVLGHRTSLPQTHSLTIARPVTKRCSHLIFWSPICAFYLSCWFSADETQKAPRLPLIALGPSKLSTVCAVSDRNGSRIFALCEDILGRRHRHLHQPQSFCGLLGMNAPFKQCLSLPGCKLAVQLSAVKRCAPALIRQGTPPRVFCSSGRFMFTALVCSHARWECLLSLFVSWLCLLWP